MGAMGRFAQMPVECAPQPDGTTQTYSVRESALGSVETVTRGTPDKFEGVATVNSPETGEVGTPISSKKLEQTTDVKGHASSQIGLQDQKACVMKPTTTRFMVPGLGG